MKTTRIAATAGLMTLAATLLVADMAEAGGRRGRGPQRGGDGREGGPAQQLNLSEDQQAQLQALRETFRSEAKALKESGDADRDSFRALRESHREQFEAVLTDEQRSQLEQFRSERQANRPERGDRRGHRGHRGGDRPNLGEALGLSEDQQAQIQTLRGDLRSQLQALRESGDGSREQAQALRKAHREQVHELLTEEQLAALEELRTNRPHRGADDEAAVDETQTDAAQKSTATVESRSWGSLKADRR